LRTFQTIQSTELIQWDYRPIRGLILPLIRGRTINSRPIRAIGGLGRPRLLQEHRPVALCMFAVKQATGVPPVIVNADAFGLHRHVLDTEVTVHITLYVMVIITAFGK